MKKYPVWLKANVPVELRAKYEKAAKNMHLELETYVRLALINYSEEHKL